MNIGLVPGDAQKRLNPSDCALLWQDDRLAAACRWAVDKLQGPVMIHRHAGSEAHEPFVVLEGTQVQADELFDREVYRLAAYLDQDCIAVQAHSIGTSVREPGRLVGPFTKAWEPFRQTLFHTIPAPPCGWQTPASSTAWRDPSPLPSSPRARGCSPHRNPESAMRNSPVPPILPFMVAAAAAATVSLAFCAPAGADAPPETLTASAEGVSVVIYRTDTAKCPPPGRRAQFFPKSGPSIEGCWVFVRNAAGAIFVQVDWSDGDQDHIPAGEFVKPQGGV